MSVARKHNPAFSQLEKSEMVGFIVARRCVVMKKHRAWKIITFILTVLLYALVCNITLLPSIAKADILDFGDGTIYRLTADSSYQEGCFPPCMCPIMLHQSLVGILKLTHTGKIDGVDVYSVDYINWLLEKDGIQIPITGSGTYSICSPGVLPVMQHRMELDLIFDKEPCEHFDSGWSVVEDMSRINIAISINNMFCWDKAIFIDALRVHADQIKAYSLVEGSTFQRGCWDPCDCLIGLEFPMNGTFSVVPLDENILLRRYAVVGVDWQVLKDQEADMMTIKGFGLYYIQAQTDATIQHRLILALTMDQELLTRFDSGLDAGGSDFPRMDIVVSVNGMQCFDTVLHVIAQPADSKQCGGIAGIPCEGLEEFCKLSEGHCCCDFFGVCTPIPDVCPDVWMPVCGCNGITYGNECEADAAAVSIDYRGICDTKCESDFTCDGDVDGSDASTFKTDFGRSSILKPCTTESPCHGDFNCDHDCDGTDASKFKSDFGRSSIQNPCPACEVGEWCQYQ